VYDSVCSIHSRRFRDMSRHVPCSVFRSLFSLNISREEGDAGIGSSGRDNSVFVP